MRHRAYVQEQYGSTEDGAQVGIHIQDANAILDTVVLRWDAVLLISPRDFTVTYDPSKRLTTVQTNLQNKACQPTPLVRNQTRLAQVYGSAKSGRESDSVVTLESTWELFQLHDAIANMTVAVDPGWPAAADVSIRFQDICYRNQLGACAFSGCATCADCCILHICCAHCVWRIWGGTQATAALMKQMTMPCCVKFLLLLIMQVPAVLEF